MGIVAGGLKAGTVPASWGWPAEWIANLLTSQEPRNTPVTIAGTFYTLRDLSVISNAIQTGRSMKCGDLNFSYRGRRSYSDVTRGSDDQQRLQIITQFSQVEDLDELQFDVWVHTTSGATALMPAGYSIASENGACVARSRTGPFQQVLWAKFAQPFELPTTAQNFETQIMFPRVPYGFGWRWDAILTKFPLDNFDQPNFTAGPLPQTRSDGLIFTRKSFIHPKTQLGFPLANSFETLAARNGSFMGVGTIDDDVPLELNQCLVSRWSGTTCDEMHAHFKEWTHFVLSTQLSTYPVM